MSDVVHVVPVNDLIEHEDEDCVCGPSVEPVAHEDGSMGWLVTHHSLDGREFRERRRVVICVVVPLRALVGAGVLAAAALCACWALVA